MRIIGEVLYYLGVSAPSEWLFLHGQALSKTTYAALYTIFGDAYTQAGTASTDFNLPDCRGRFIRSTSTPATLGAIGGVENVALTIGQIPAHSHLLRANGNSPNTTSPSGNVLAAGAVYNSDDIDQNLAEECIGEAGGGEFHTNMPPYVTINIMVYTGVS